MNSENQKTSPALVAIPVFRKADIAVILPGTVSINERSGFKKLRDHEIDSAYAGTHSRIKINDFSGYFTIETYAGLTYYKYSIDAYLSNMGSGGEFCHRVKFQTNEIGELLTQLAKFNAVILKWVAS